MYDDIINYGRKKIMVQAPDLNAKLGLFCLEDVGSVLAEEVASLGSML
jgi:hypothetical protein